MQSRVRFDGQPLETGLGYRMDPSRVAAGQQGRLEMDSGFRNYDLLLPSSSRTFRPCRCATICPYLIAKADEGQPGEPRSRDGNRHRQNILLHQDRVRIGPARDVRDAVLRRLQIREAIHAHFEKEWQLFAKGIKVLTLLFIDEVANTASTNAARRSRESTPPSSKTSTRSV